MHFSSNEDFYISIIGIYHDIQGAIIASTKWFSIINLEIVSVQNVK